MEPLGRLLMDHPFFNGMSPDQVTFLAGCAKNVRFLPGEFLFKEGGPVDQIYLIRHGKILLQAFAPGRGPLIVAAAHEGEVVGWSALVEPFRARFDAVAYDHVVATCLDAICVRAKCEKDSELGYAMLFRVVNVLENRLQATRMQLLDLYASAC